MWASNVTLDTGGVWIVKDFQRAVLADVFAGRSEVWMVVPEGSGKTTLMAGLGLYHGDFMPSAEVLLAASSRDQAELLFRQAAGMIERSPWMAERYSVHEGYRRIRCLRTGGRLQIFAASDRTGDGVLPTLGILDELHRHRDLRLYRTWRGKLPKRDGQLVAISTAGEPGTEFEETRERIRSESPDIVVDGCHLRAADGNLVLHDWSVPADGDVDDFELVAQANPLASVEVLADKRAAPTMTEAHWRRFVCNQAVRSEESAINEREWLAAKTDDRPSHGESCLATLDAAWKWDTTAIVPLFDRPEFVLVGEPTVLEPPRDGTSLSPEAVKSALARLHDRHPFELLVMDGAAGGELLGEWVEQELGAQVVVHSNGHAAQALAYRRWMEGLREGSLRHVGDPVLTRHVLNAAAKLLPLGDHRFVRQSSARTASLQDRRVIDCLSAASAGFSVLVEQRNIPAPEPERSRVPVSF